MRESFTISTYYISIASIYANEIMHFINMKIMQYIFLSFLKIFITYLKHFISVYILRGPSGEGRKSDFWIYFLRQISQNSYNPSQKLWEATLWLARLFGANRQTRILLLFYKDKKAINRQCTTNNPWLKELLLLTEIL